MSVVVLVMSVCNVYNAVGVFRFYCQAILQEDSFGSYWLAGYSYGGMVVFEMARQLQREGKKVSYLPVYLNVGSEGVSSQYFYVLPCTQGHRTNHTSIVTPCKNEMQVTRTSRKLVHSSANSKHRQLKW